jgi:glycosyltransferase involved in cell wall biosynthesis
MASVLLPTREWTEACEELVAQIDGADELFFICDTPTDPVMTQSRDRDFPPNVDVLVAGQPDGCSGKANALSHGIERASHERIVCTDDDFAHGDGWLDEVKALGARHGTVSTVPVFVSDGWLWKLLEPMLMIGSLALYLRNGVWGGVVTFERSAVDLERLQRDLRRTVSDDGLMWEQFDDVTTVRSLRRRVPVDGHYRSILHRWARFVRTFYFFAPNGLCALLVSSLLVLLLTLLVSVVAAIGVTLLGGAVYRTVGVDRWTYLFTFPAFLLFPILLAVGLAKREFDWGNRRYRWSSKFDVSVRPGNSDG